MTHDMTVNQKALQHVPPYSSLLTWIWMIWQSFWRPSGTCIDAGTITWLHAVPLSHCTKKTSTKYRAKKTAQGNIEIPIRKKAFRAYPPGNSHILSGERENHLKGPLKGNILVFRRVPRMVVMFMYHNCVVGIPKVQSRTTFLRVGNVLKITCSSSLFFLKKKQLQTWTPKVYMICCFHDIPSSRKKMDSLPFNFAAAFPKQQIQIFSSRTFRIRRIQWRNPIDMLSHPYNPWEW